MKKRRPIVWILDDEWSSHQLEKDFYQQHGFEVKITKSDTLEKDIPQYAPYADGVVVQVGFPCREDLIDQLQACKVIAVPGVGYNHVDVEAAARKGITVANVPDYCVEEVSDHTIALMFALTRQLSSYHHKVRDGKWDPLDTQPIHRFSEKTIGLLGFGRIARMVAAKLKPFGVRLLAHDEYVFDEIFDMYGVTPVSLTELMQLSNVLSLHVPLNEETNNLLNYERLKLMPKGSFIINTCRGGVVNEEALQKLIQEGHLAGAGLDVLEKEPPERDHPLLKMDEVIITPHASYVSEESLVELRERTCQVIVEGIQGKALNSALKQEKVNM
ncbi:C-terminal binding protein [Bacillus sp. B190/17]|uniref:C-terminal binding protein n=1 Tax=Bacillus lumedeiriae TaxID=3058829 RepID=A0ABW8IAZ4_9BACI